MWPVTGWINRLALAANTNALSSARPIRWLRERILIIENEEWVEQNFGGCQLGNTLRDNRLKIVAKNMLERPDRSLPQQNADWSDLKAAYNLFDRPEATLEAIARVHWEKTRATSCKHVLLICDTTDLSHQAHKATTGLGILGDGRGSGFQLHSCLMVDSQSKSIIGVAGAKFYHRKRVPKNETRKKRLARDRESLLWSHVVDAVGRQPEGSTWIHVFDRGGDNFEALCHIVHQKCGWLIRVGQMSRKIIGPDEQVVPMKNALKSAKVLGTYDLHLRTRPGVAARVAKIEVSSMTIKLPRPSKTSKFVKECDIGEIETNLLIVKEINPPKGVKKISWILMTSLAVRTFEQAWRVIEYYESRWLIEEYHKCLKTGCNIQGHSLRTSERLQAVSAITSVLAVRLLSLKMDARNAPDVPVRNRIPPAWLKALIALKPKLSKSTLTVYNFFREVAKLGGFLGRKHDGEPGWQTVWSGLLELLSIVHGMELAQKQG
jgi:hypothetical protein